MSKLEQKIESFIRKYYSNELLRGLIFFLAIGLSYFLITLIIEYFLWLNPGGRAVLFWSFVTVELVLFFRFICIPLARLFKLTKGIDINQASMMIGNHFPEVSDKLINTLQLRHNTTSDLALASIAQRSKELEPVPFTLAIDYRKNSKYLKWLLVPVIIFLVVNFSSGNAAFGSSYDRMLHYNKAYEPPAPFSFFVVSDSLTALEGKNFTIEVSTEGDQIPESAQIHFGESQFYMKKEAGGRFTYVIERPSEDTQFYFTANQVTSMPYNLKVIRTPFISDFTMRLTYPGHTGKGSEIIKNTGTVSVPEGTRISWRLDAQETNKIEWITRDTSLVFDKGNDVFTLARNIYTNTPYTIATSNASLSRYESLDYVVRTIPDAYPKIKVEMKKDTVDGLQNYHYGQISDDYGLRSLNLVYFDENNPDKLIKDTISISKSTVYNFISAFPGNYLLVDGTSYGYYFEVRDNDAIHRYKTSRSETFHYRKLSTTELEEQQLQQQEKSISGLDQSVKKFEKQTKELEDLKMLQKEKENLNFNDQQRLKSFFDRQKQQDKMMREFSENLRKNLQDFNYMPEQKDDVNDMLQERLIENEDVLRQREKLLEELKEAQDKLGKEELSEKLDQLAKQNSNSKRSLKQLVELTKRFYVQKKMERISKEMEKLGQEQMDLSKDPESNTPEKQKALNEKFEQLEKSIEDLKKENEELKSPMDVPEDVPMQESIKEDQREAEDLLNKKEEGAQEKAGQKQKQAGQKMKQLGKQMMSEMSQSSGQEMQEDVNMLRQILDNLVEFSFEEEGLMDKFKIMDNRNPKFSSSLVMQGELKDNFQHIDDSLFSLSLRRPELEEIINSQLTNIDYSLDQALERLSDNRIPQGTSSQQYVVSGANTLAELLSDVLDNMQNQMAMMSKGSNGIPMPGSRPKQGQGAGQQLSDIIMSQEDVNKKIGEGEKEGNSGQKGNTNGDGKEGDQGQGNEGGAKQGQGGQQNGETGQGGGQGANGMNQGLSESEMENLYNIYKQQQEIRKQLEDYIEDHGLMEEAGNLLKEMEKAENDLLENGLNSENRNRLNNVQHELLKLKEAENEQGEDDKREARTSYDTFTNPVSDFTPQAAEYFNNKEILNRESLPLQGDFKLKVQLYFNKND